MKSERVDLRPGSDQEYIEDKLAEQLNLDHDSVAYLLRLAHLPEGRPSLVKLADAAVSVALTKRPKGKGKVTPREKETATPVY